MFSPVRQQQRYSVGRLTHLSPTPAPPTPSPLRLAVSRFSATSVVVVVSVVSSSHARQALKGDPGELGDVGFDLSHYQPSDEVKSRAKRYYLSFPSSSTLTFNNKIKVPLFSKFNSNITGVFKGFIRVKYTLPTDTVAVGRSDINTDRYDTYNSLEAVFSNMGINGRECLLKAICESAEDSPADYGLMGQLVHLVLSPNHGPTSTSRDQLREYRAAESYGQDAGNCGLAYPTCPFHLPDLLAAGLSLLQGSVSGFPGM
ncbi:hypothetical protein Pcinc_038247 [Petrolisthes cinctipes]|uniref:Uncharacterized protein n=1 Tax=Petrolisthes cinctipes TaxID=88211 RepID=A0AAE1BQY0_PETCI|nr:hypothetical protein Pcinc_038247 [Petrolisthes cinctipes]